MQGPFDCEKQDKAIVDGYLQTLDEFEKKIYGPFLRKEEAASEVQRLDTQYTLIQLQLFAPPLIKRLKRQRLERAICELETRMKAARWRMKVRLAFQRRSLASAQAKYAEIDQVLALSPDNPKELEKLIPEETECDQAIVSTVQNQVQEGIMMWKKKEEDLTEQYFLDKFEREAKTEIERFSKIASKNTLPPDSSAPL
jgi:hypothetical protein